MQVYRRAGKGKHETVKGQPGRHARQGRQACVLPPKSAVCGSSTHTEVGSEGRQKGMKRQREATGMMRACRQGRQSRQKKGSSPSSWSFQCVQAAMRAAKRASMKMEVLRIKACTERGKIGGQAAV